MSSLSTTFEKSKNIKSDSIQVKQKVKDNNVNMINNNTITNSVDTINNMVNISATNNNVNITINEIKHIIIEFNNTNVSLITNDNNLIVQMKLPPISSYESNIIEFTIIVDSSNSNNNML